MTDTLLKEHLQNLQHYIVYIGDQVQDPERELWKNQYAQASLLTRLEDINQSADYMLSDFKDNSRTISLTDFDKLFSNIKQFTEYLESQNQSTHHVPKLGELFAHLAFNIKFSEEDEKTHDDYSFLETLYLRAKELANINNPRFLFQNPQEVQYTLNAVEGALTHINESIKEITAIGHGNKQTDDLFKALQILTDNNAYKEVDSYPYVVAYINLVVLTKYTRNVQLEDVEDVARELNLMKERLNQNITESTKDMKLSTTASNSATSISTDFRKKD